MRRARPWPRSTGRRWPTMFDPKELSARDGRPLHLFKFARQSNVWLLCSGDRDQVIGSDTYVHAPIARSEIKQTVERAQAQITVTFPYVRDPAGSNDFSACQA